MRVLPVTLMLLAATTLASLAPTAQAVGTCTFLDPKCPAIACIGTSWSYGDRYYTCQTKIGGPIPVPCRDYPCCRCMPIEEAVEMRLLP